jgi:glycosyltransferase involved in cell wall biosynthesis
MKFMPEPEIAHHTPAVSVIIPAYNQARYLRKAIQSVLEQTDPDFELLVVGDGSTDETPQGLASIHDPRMRVVRQPNAGLSAARNTGIRESSAPLVTRQASDEFFQLDKLSIQKEYLDHHAEIGLVSGGTLYIDQNDEVFKESIEYSGLLDLRELLFRNPFMPSAVMFRRAWLERVGVFDETLRACEDWDLWRRMAYAGCQLAWVNRPVAAYRFHSGQMTRDSDRMHEAMMRITEKFFCQPGLPEEYRAIKNSVYAAAYVHSAAFAYNAEQYHKGQDYLNEAMRLDPALTENCYRQLVDALAGWSNDPRSVEPVRFLQRVAENPPPGRPGLERQLRCAIADTILGSLFNSSKATWRSRRKDLGKAISYKPEWLLNRGVLRMVVFAWLGL